MDTKITLPFDKKLVSLIQDGQKIFTYRLGHKYDAFNVGEVVYVSDSSTDQIFGQVEITGKNYVQFKDLPTKRSGHEEYASKEEMRKTLSGYYHTEIKDEADFLVFEFRLIKLFASQ